MSRTTSGSRHFGAVIGLLGLMAGAVEAQAVAKDAPAAGAARSDSTDAARVVSGFHQALERGDSAAALALLAPDASILESGAVETVAEYRAHHLPADIEYARAIPGGRAPLRVQVRGDVAWAVGSSESRGEFRGRPVNSAGAELMVLTRTSAGWRISAIHWSSRRRTS
ncbi:MAG: YybH family protein [Gemmatirosa sp.]